MWKITKSSQEAYGIKKIICDTEADKDKVPKTLRTFGTIAFIIENSNTYMANSSYEWQKTATPAAAAGTNTEKVEVVPTEIDGGGALMDDNAEIVDGGGASEG